MLGELWLCLCQKVSWTSPFRQAREGRAILALRKCSLSCWQLSVQCRPHFLPKSCRRSCHSLKGNATSTSITRLRVDSDLRCSSRLPSTISYQSVYVTKSRLQNKSAGLIKPHVFAVFLSTDNLSALPAKALRVENVRVGGQ